MGLYTDAVIADSPSSYWFLDEVSGTDAVPTRGSFHGTYVDVVLNQTGLLASETRPSVYFNGTSAVITTGSTLNVTLPFTIEMWIKPNQDSMIGVFDSAPNQTNVIRNLPGDQFDWWGCNVTYNFVSGTRYHVVVVCSTNSGSRVITLYVNGSQVATNTLSGTGYSVTTWRFGDINYGNSGYYKGWMQDLAVYSGKALNSTRVLAHYQAGLVNRIVGTALPLEIPGGMGKYAHVPLFFEGEHQFYSGMFGGRIEYTGWLPTEGKDVPIENWHQLWRRATRDLRWSVDLGWLYPVDKLPVGAAGWLYRHRKSPLDVRGLTALLNSWNTLQPGVGHVSHSWSVATELTTGSLDHSWTVQTETGGDVPHLWRVVEPKLVTLHGQDIQLPYGHLEKT